MRFEIAQLDALMHTYAPLLDLVEQRDPDSTELLAICSLLHSFYNGIEKLFVFVAKEIDQAQLTSPNWHASLLNSMGNTLGARTRVISQRSVGILREYLAFRHFFRHSYSFDIQWDRCRSLALDMRQIWVSIKSEIEDFMTRLTENKE
jgi:hypothetical protein